MLLVTRLVVKCAVTAILGLTGRRLRTLFTALRELYRPAKKWTGVISFVWKISIYLMHIIVAIALRWRWNEVYMTCPLTLLWKVFVVYETLSSVLMSFPFVLLVIAGHMLHAALLDTNEVLGRGMARRGDPMEPQADLTQLDIRILRARYVHLRHIHQQLADAFSPFMVAVSFHAVVEVVMFSMHCIVYSSKPQSAKEDVLLVAAIVLDILCIHVVGCTADGLSHAVRLIH